VSPFVFHLPNKVDQQTPWPHPFQTSQAPSSNATQNRNDGSKVMSRISAEWRVKGKSNELDCDKTAADPVTVNHLALE